MNSEFGECLDAIVIHTLYVEKKAMFFNNKITKMTKITGKNQKVHPSLLS